MQQFIELVKRNMRIYLRDKGAIFFSLLSMVIVIGLMVLFLGDMNVNAITGLLGSLPERDAVKDKDNAKLLVLVWTCAGIIPINAVTVTLASLSSMIKDRTTGKINSIYTSPVSRLSISAGYVCSSWASSVIICIVTLAIAEIYCITQGAEAFSLITHFQLCGLIAVNSFTYASIMYLIAILAKTEGAWSGIGTVVGTLVGFLGGIYLPIGSVSDGIASVMKCTPVIYSTVMFRKIMVNQTLETVFDKAPDEMVSEYSEVMGITMNAFNHDITIGISLVILAVFGIIFLAVGTFLTEFGRKSDR